MVTPFTRQAISAICAANFFWAVIFGGKLVNFWLGMSVAATTLACGSIYFSGLPFVLREVTWRRVLLGVLSAGVLYGAFYLGNAIADRLFGFAQRQVADIYGIRNEAAPLTIFFVLFFITSPAEEIFWRGFLQRWATLRFGCWQGWLLAAVIYGAVHLWSGNIMLTLAAFTAGAFWGGLYWKSGSLIPCIVSHAVWTVSVFIFFPIGV